MTTSASTRLPALGYAGIVGTAGIPDHTDLQPAWIKDGWHWLSGHGPNNVSRERTFTVLAWKESTEGLLFAIESGLFHRPTWRLYVWPGATLSSLAARLYDNRELSEFYVPPQATQLKLRTNTMPDIASIVRFARSYAKNAQAVREENERRQAAWTAHRQKQANEREEQQAREDVDVTAAWKTPAPWTLRQDEKYGRPVLLRWLYVTANQDKFRLTAYMTSQDQWILGLTVVWRGQQTEQNYSFDLLGLPALPDLPTSGTASLETLVTRVQDFLPALQRSIENQSQRHHAVLAQLPSAPMAWWRAGVPAAMAFPGTKGDEEQVRSLPLGALLLLLDTRGIPLCLPSIPEAAEGQRKARRALFYSGLVDGLPDGYGEATVHLSSAGRAAVARYKAEAARGDATQMEGPAGSYEGFPLTHTQERAKRGFTSLWHAGDFGPFSTKNQMEEAMHRWVDWWQGYSTADVVKEMVDEAADRVQITDRRTGEVETMSRDAHRKRVMAGEYDRVEMRWKPDNTPRAVT